MLISIHFEEYMNGENMNLLSLFNNPEERFWKWFVENENMLFNFETNREPIFDKLNIELGKVHTGLTFEFGPLMDDGTREFIISADGIKKVFPLVESLFKKRPKLKRWRVIKFRPRRNPINDLTIDNKTIKADEVNYILFKDRDPNKVGIMLFFKEYQQDINDTLEQIGYLLLDEALGEYDVETRIGAVAFESTDSKYYVQSHPLKELSEDFDGQFYQG